MVLVCHPARFIFMKTHKTASTSVEMYFERFCVPPERFLGTESVPQIVSAAGVVGGRRDGKRRGDLWYNHMPAERVRELLGAETWARYFRFATVRNPFSQMLSNFFWLTHRRPPTDDAAFAKARRAFARFVTGPLLWRRKWSNDLHIVGIDGRVEMDRLIRFEHLAADTAAVCAHLGLPFDPALMPHTKRARQSGRRYALAEYYTPALEAIVLREFDWLFSRLDYRRTP